MTNLTPPPDAPVSVDKTTLALILTMLMSLVTMLTVLVSGSGSSSGNASASPSSAIPSSSVPVSSAPVSNSPSTPIGCLLSPSTCGFPDATNTGARGALAVHAGKYVTSKDGEVVENVEIQGCLQVKNAGVVIDNVKIDGGCLYSLDLSNATGHTTVTDTTIIGTSAQLAGAVLRNATLTRVNITGGQDGIDAWGGAGGGNVVQDSFIHNLTRNTSISSHDDTLQTSGGDQAFSHNTLLPFDGTDPMNSCLQIGALQGNLAQLTFTGNLCDGGNYSLNANSSGVGSTITAGPLTFTGNRFGRDYRYGIKAHLGAPFSTTWSGNVDDVTGNPV